MSVTSLNTLTGNINLQSTAGTISILNTVAGNINLEASHTGSQGGVLNLGVLPAPGGQQPLTGQLSLQSSGGSVVFTYPDGGYAQGGHKINVEAVAGGVVGVNTINNVASDALHNFTLTAGANVTIASGTNALTISSTDTVGVASLQQNAGNVFTGAVRLVNGANITMSDVGAGIIEIASTDTVGVASISNVAGGTPIVGAVNIVPKNSGIGTLVLGQELQIENTGVLGIIPNANGLPQPPPLVGNVGLVAGTNVSLVESGQNITINASGDGAGIETINTILPLAGEFGINGGSGITIATPVANAIEIVNAGVLSVATGANPPAVGAISLVAGTNVSITEAVAGAFTINASGDGAGIETINTISPLAGEFAITGGSGITIATPVANAIEIVNGGLLSVQLTGVGTPITGAITLTTGAGITGSEPVAGTIDIVNSGVLSVVTGANTPATGAISLVAGANVSITEATVGAFTIASTGGGGGGVTGFEVNNDILSTGVLHLNEATGITMTRGVMNDGVYFFNSGVLSVATGASTPATGAISLVAGANVSITEATAGAFTIASTGGGGGGVLTISGIAPNGAGDWTLDNGTGIGYTSLVPAQQGIQLTNTGVLSVKANSGGVPFTGAITIAEGSGISITETAGGIINVINTAQGGGGAYTYTSNVAYPLTDPGNYFHNPAVAPNKYSISDKTALYFFTATWDLATLTITPDGAGTGLVAGDTLVSGNSTHFFSCPNSWGANLTVNRYVYSPASQDTIVIGNAYLFTTIYDIAANDTSIYILAQTSLGTLSVLAYNLSTTSQTRTIALIYDASQPNTFSFNNLTASEVSGVGYISIGVNGTYTPLTGTPQTTGLLVVLQDTFVSSPTTVFTSYDYYTNSGSSVYTNVCCQYSNQLPSPAYFVSYYNSTTSTSYIDEWDNTGAFAPISSTPVGNLVYHMNNPWNNSPNSFFAQTTLSDGSSGQQVYKTCSPPDANNSPISGLINSDNYSLYGAYGAVNPPTPPIYLSSSLIDDQYLYQQSAFLVLTVINEIPIGALITLEFEVPCSASVVAPLLFFPVGANAIVSINPTLLPASGSIVSVVPSGTATIHIEINTSIIIPVAGAVVLTLPQFTILPPPPP